MTPAVDPQAEYRRKLDDLIFAIGTGRELPAATPQQISNARWRVENMGIAIPSRKPFWLLG